MATQKVDKPVSEQQEDNVDEDTWIEKIERMPYHHFHLAESDIRNLVSNVGDFLLARDFGSENAFSIWVRSDTAVIRTEVSFDGEAFSVSGKLFASVQSLVDYFVESAQSIVAGGSVTLKRPIARQPWEILTGQFQIDDDEELGRGAFGVVSKAKLRENDNGKSIVVAAKIVRGNDVSNIDRETFFAEARIAKQIGLHPNIVRCFGISIDTEHPIMFFEYVNGGDLKSRLVDRKQKQCELKTKIRIALDIASALKHLGALGIAHRDLAARNVLLEKSSTDIDGIGVSKLADFGRARMLDANGKFTSTADNETRMPFLWSAPESLERLVWTTSSDVWSFNCLLYEILSNGEQPYWNFGGELNSAVDLLKELRNGLRLQCPQGTPAAVAHLMENGFAFEMAKRPNVSDMVKILEEILNTIK